MVLGWATRACVTSTGMLNPQLATWVLFDRALLLCVLFWNIPYSLCQFVYSTYKLLKSGAVAWTLLTHWGQACFSVLGHSLSRCWFDVIMREAVNRATYTYWNHIYFCLSYVTFRDLVMLHIWEMVVCIMSTISIFVVVGNDKHCNTVVEHMT